MQTFVFIALGSNLHQPVQQVLSAINRLKVEKDLSVTAISSLYETPPMGPQDQPNYINAVVKASTTLQPLALLTLLQSIENHHGRNRDTGRWGARTLDLDILLYGQHCSTDPVLTLPHPGIAVRGFVLHPLFEIEPPLVIPLLGSVEQLLVTLNEPCPAIVKPENLENCRLV